MGDMGKRIFTPIPPKCTIFIFKIQKFFSGEGDTPSPHPTPLGASILATAVLDGTPRKISGYGPVTVENFLFETYGGGRMVSIQISKKYDKVD
jgi:hypothetical protein